MATKSKIAKRRKPTGVKFDYGSKDPDHPEVLASRIFSCGHIGCSKKKQMTLSGIKVHCSRMHGGDVRAFRIDGHPVTESLLAFSKETRMKRSRRRPQTRTKKERHIADQPRPSINPLRFCPCCGVSLEAFLAAGELMG
jgi:hypothetical protein